MEFTPKYFEGEVRDGFYVQPMIKRVWAAQLDILKEVDRICEKYNIKYIAIYGTLLGAVRHKGYVPWDDDMDIAMLRKDYERFCRIAKKELPGDWDVLIGGQGEYDQPFSRIVNDDKGTIVLKERKWERFHNCPYIMGIDLFPLDNMPNDIILQKEMLSLVADLVLAVDDLKLYDTEPKKAKDAIKEIEKLTGQHLDCTKSLISQTIHLADRVAAMYWDEETENVAHVALAGAEVEKKYPFSCFDEIIRIPFENTTIPVIKDYDLMLRRIYGEDYMQPRLSASSHEYPFIKKQAMECEKYFKEAGIWEAFHCFYRKKDGRPLVSVVVPCIQAEAGIDRCLNSLFCQTIAVTNLEIICIADVSDGATLVRLKEWEKKLGDILMIVEFDEEFSWETAGNIGLEYASADYVAFADANDWVEMSYLEQLYRPVEIVAFDVVSCVHTGRDSRALLIDSEEKRKGFLSLFSLGREVFGKIIKKELLLKNHIVFHEQVDNSSFYFEMQLHMCVKNVYLHEEILYHRNSEEVK